MAVITTFAPARSKAKAIARPIPRPPPVTIAVLPESSLFAIGALPFDLAVGCILRFRAASRKTKVAQYSREVEADEESREPLRYQAPAGLRAGFDRGCLPLWSTQLSQARVLPRVHGSDNLDNREEGRPKECITSLFAFAAPPGAQRI